MPIISQWYLYDKITNENNIDLDNIQKYLTLNHKLQIINHAIFDNLGNSLETNILLKKQLAEWNQRSLLKLKVDNFKYQTALLINQVFSEKSFPIHTNLEHLAVLLDDLYTQSSLINQSALFNNNKNLLDNQHIFSKTILEANQIISSFSHLFNSHETISGIILLQNNLELRPTGGFISGIVSFQIERGVITSLNFQDVYSLDSRLNGQVAPPESIKEQLGEGRWYLRDANWDPDFYNSAKQSAWFYEKITNQPVDVVIGLNLFTLQNLLDATGEVSLTDGRRINHKNIFEQAQFHQDINFNQNGGNKQEFMSLVLESIYRRLITSDASSVNLTLAQALFKSLHEQQLIIASFDDEIERAFVTAGISGTVTQPLCPNESIGVECISDYFYLNEANIGINKANFYVNREHAHLVTISANSFNIVHQITLSNSSPTNDWPSGAYKSYLRIYLPKNSQNIGLKIDNASVSSSIYNQQIILNHKVLSLSVDIPIQESSKLVVNYDIPIKDSSENPSYSFFLQKQSGIEPFPLSIDIQLPSEYSVKHVIGDLRINNRNLSANTIVDSNYFVLVELVR